MTRLIALIVIIIMTAFIILFFIYSFNQSHKFNDKCHKLNGENVYFSCIKKSAIIEIEENNDND